MHLSRRPTVRVPSGRGLRGGATYVSTKVVWQPGHRGASTPCSRAGRGRGVACDASRDRVAGRHDVRRRGNAVRGSWSAITPLREVFGLCRGDRPVRHRLENGARRTRQLITGHRGSASVKHYPHRRAGSRRTGRLNPPQPSAFPSGEMMLTPSSTTVAAPHPLCRATARDNGLSLRRSGLRWPAGGRCSQASRPRVSGPCPAACDRRRRRCRSAGSC